MTDLLGYLGPVLLAMSVSLFALIYMYLFMPESLEKDKRVKKLDLNILKEMQFIPKLKTYTENRVMKYILIKRVSFLLVFSSFSSIFILYLVDVLKLTSQEIGYFFVIIGLMIVFNQIFIVGSLSKKLGNYKSLMIGLIMVTFAQILLGLSANLWYFFSVLYLNSLGVAMAIPTFKSLLSEHVEHDKQGEIMGLDESLVSATSVVAPLISTWLYQDLGPSVFVLQGLLLLLVLFIYFKRKGWLLRGGHK
jgi:DHA1 family tetracycline resistance protein-like MFS transporter